MAKICDNLRASILQALIVDPDNCPEYKADKIAVLGDLPIEFLRGGGGLAKSDLDREGTYECILYGQLFTRFNDGIINANDLSHTKKKTNIVSKSGDILVPGTSTAGRDVMLRARELYRDGVEIGGDINIVRQGGHNIFYPKYMSYVFDTQSSKTQLYGYITGATGIIHISNKGIKKLRFYLPPLAEQKRIVEKIDELFARVADLERSADALASLNKTFPDDIKASILQAAMQGKLTEQQPSDGSAEDLYQQIQAEKAKLIKEGKIKRSKPLPLIDPDEVPFDIPESWKWVRLGTVYSITAGGTPARGNPDYWDGNIPWVKIGDMAGKYVDRTSEAITQLSLSASSAKIMPPGTILYSIFASIGAVSILRINACTNQAIACLRGANDLIDEQYAYYALRSLSSILVEVGRGMAQNNINQKILANSLIPLPPLAEQKRIVEKLNNLLAAVDSIAMAISNQ